MAEGRPSHTASADEISLLGDDVSEFDPTTKPDDDIDARLFNLLSNPKKRNMDRVQPLPRNQGKPIRSRKTVCGAALHAGEKHGPVPKPISEASPTTLQPSGDLLAVRRTPVAPLETATADAAWRASERGDYARHASSHERRHSHGEPSASARVPPGTLSQQQQQHQIGAFDYAVSGVPDHGERGSSYADDRRARHDAVDDDGTIDPRQFVTAGYDADRDVAIDVGHEGAHAYREDMYRGDGSREPYGLDQMVGHERAPYNGSGDDPSSGADAFSMAVHQAQYDESADSDTARATEGGAVDSSAWMEPTYETSAQRTWLGVAEAAAFDAHAAEGGLVPLNNVDRRGEHGAAVADNGSYPQSPVTTYAHEYGQQQQQQYVPRPPSPLRTSSAPHTEPFDRPRYPEEQRHAPEAEDPATIERHAKHAALLNLRLLEEQGIKLSRPFTMDDPLYDMEYEWDAYHHRRNHIEGIQSVHEKIAVAEMGVMILNGVGGRLFKRKGGLVPPAALKQKWDKALADHKGTIEAVARKYYGPHAGSSAQTPEMRLGIALAIGIGGAAAMSLGNAFVFGGGDDDMGGGGSDRDSRSDDRHRRRRRDDRRSALRKHRDAATSSSNTDGWRDALGGSGLTPYPQPPQAWPGPHPSYPPGQEAPPPSHGEPFSRAPGSHHTGTTGQNGHALGMAEATTPHQAAPPAASLPPQTPWDFSNPQQQQPPHHQQQYYGQQHTQQPPSLAQTTPAQMDPYQSADESRAASSPSASQTQQFDHASTSGDAHVVGARTRPASADQRVAHMGALAGSGRPPFAASAPAPSASQQVQPSGTPAGRRVMGRVAKPR
jgi:hypothetical protein